MTYDPELIDRLARRCRSLRAAVIDPVEFYYAARDLLGSVADQLEAARREVERLRPVEPWVAELQREVDAWRSKAEVALKLFGETQGDVELMRSVVDAAVADLDAECSCDDYGSWNGHVLKCAALLTSLALEAAIDAYRAAKGKT